MLITEPEAAALYCATLCKEVDLKIGNRFLICDAGGGTVVHTPESLSPEPPESPSPRVPLVSADFTRTALPPCPRADPIIPSFAILFHLFSSRSLFIVRCSMLGCPLTFPGNRT